MKKIELLSPVGDFECLKAAVQNGADSVYFGSSNFNARTSATNFDLSSLREAILYSKLRGVNTHLTLNTLIKDDEFDDAVLLAQKAYEFGIDAIIVQDLGLANYLIKTFPDLPIHASTQMTIHDLMGVKEVEKLGFKRAVLSREVSIDEINYICSHSKIEIETFIHGALCISYSGQCLFSSMVGGRSGNRGKCAQPCRLPYELIVQGKEVESSRESLSKGYLLSPRDLCGLNYIPDLIKAGVKCFKIEGRMKSPEYVATTTRIYRKYIDLALSDEPYKIDDKDVKDLMQVFNRGNFSTGHLDSKPNKNLIYPKKQNHMGIYVGNVSNIKQNKGHVLVSLKDKLSLGDAITFEKENTKYTISELMVKNKNILTASEGQLVEIGRMKGNISSGDKVYKLSSKELSVLAKESYKGENKKIHLIASIDLQKDEPIVLNVSTIKNCNPIFDNIKVCISSDDTPIEAKNKPIDGEKILSQLTKTNDTIYEFDNININLGDNLFLPSYKILNELRRNALDEITTIAKQKILRESPTSKSIDLKAKKKAKAIKDKNKRKITVLLNILNENVNYTSLKDVDNVYIPLKYFSNKKYVEMINSLTNKFNVYIYLPTIIKSNYRNLLDAVINKTISNFNIKGFIVSNIASAMFIEKMKETYKDKYEFIGNYTLNIYNNQTINEQKELGINRLTVSPELDFNTIKNVTNYSVLPQELIVYGRTPLMNTNYCFLGNTNKCYPTCGLHCSDKSDYYLKDRMGLYFPIIPDKVQTVTTIYNSKITSIDGSQFNVDSYRIDILEETIDEINNIVQSVKNNKRLEGKEYTNGNLNRDI